MLSTLISELNAYEKKIKKWHWWSLFSSRKKEKVHIAALRAALSAFRKNPKAHVLDWMNVLCSLETHLYRKRSFWRRWLGIKSSGSPLYRLVCGWRRRFQSHQRRLFYSASRGSRSGYLDKEWCPYGSNIMTLDNSALDLLFGRSETFRMVLLERMTWDRSLKKPNVLWFQVASEGLPVGTAIQRFVRCFQYRALSVETKRQLSVFLRGWVNRYTEAGMIGYFSEGIRSYGAEACLENGMMALWLEQLQESRPQAQSKVLFFVADTLRTIIEGYVNHFSLVKALEQLRGVLSLPYVAMVLSRLAHRKQKEAIEEAIQMFCRQYYEEVSLESASDFYRLMKCSPILTLLGAEALEFSEVAAILRKRFIRFLQSIMHQADLVQYQCLIEESKALQGDLDWCREFSMALFDDVTVRQALSACVERCITRQLMLGEYRSVARQVKKGRGLIAVTPHCRVDPKGAVVGHIKLCGKGLERIEDYLNAFRLLNTVFSKKYRAFVEPFQPAWVDRFVSDYLYQLVEKNDQKQVREFLKHPPMKLVLWTENVLDFSYVSRLLIKMFHAGEFDRMHYGALTAVIAPALLKESVRLIPGPLKSSVVCDERASSVILMFGSFQERRTWHMKVLASLPKLRFRQDAFLSWVRIYTRFIGSRQKKSVLEIDTLTSGDLSRHDQYYWSELAWSQARTMHPLVGYAIARRYASEEVANAVRYYWEANDQFRTLEQWLRYIKKYQYHELSKQFFCVDWKALSSQIELKHWVALCDGFQVAHAALAVGTEIDTRWLWLQQVLDFLLGQLAGPLMVPLMREQVKGFKQDLLVALKRNFERMQQTLVRRKLAAASEEVCQFSVCVGAWSLGQRVRMFGEAGVYGASNLSLCKRARSLGCVRPDLADGLSKAHFILFLFEEECYQEAGVELQLLTSRSLDDEMDFVLAKLLSEGLRTLWEKRLASMDKVNAVLRWFSILETGVFFEVLYEKIEKSRPLVESYSAHRRGVELYRVLISFFAAAHHTSFLKLSLDYVCRLSMGSVVMLPVLCRALRGALSKATFPEPMGKAFDQFFSRLEGEEYYSDQAGRVKEDVLQLSKALFQVQNETVLPLSAISNFVSQLQADVERVVKAALNVSVKRAIPLWLFEVVSAMQKTEFASDCRWVWKAYPDHPDWDRWILATHVSLTPVQEQQLRHLLLFWGQIRRIYFGILESGQATYFYYYQAFWEVGYTLIAYQALTATYKIRGDHFLEPYLRRVFEVDQRAHAWVEGQFPFESERNGEEDDEGQKWQEILQVHELFYRRTLQHYNVLQMGRERRLGLSRLLVRLSLWWKEEPALSSQLVVLTAEVLRHLFHRVPADVLDVSLRKTCCARFVSGVVTTYAALDKAATPVVRESVRTSPTRFSIARLFRRPLKRAPPADQPYAGAAPLVMR